MYNTAAFDPKIYPNLARATRPLNLNPNPLIGMDDILQTILAGLHKDEMSNILLIAEAGGGKTATVQEFARRYNNRYLVLETSIAQMQVGGNEYMAHNFKALFHEMVKYRQREDSKRELVLFIDEIHQLPMASPAAVEDLKPEFARSAQLGVHIIGASTYEEYIHYIKTNMAFQERFQLVNLPVADADKTFKILKSRMRRQHDIKQTPQTDHLLREIVYYTDTYIKDRIQPRKSTDLFDQMLGWVRIGKPFNHKLLSDVLYRETNVRIDLQGNAQHMKDYLNSRVYNQPLAINAILGNAYSAILGVVDETKPRGVYLFVGPTGTGKAENSNTVVPIYDKSKNSITYKKHGKLNPGDWVFARDGHPEQVTAVFHHHNKTMYRVKLSDGRYLDVDGNHLWQYKSRHGNGAKKWKISNTLDLYHKMQNQYISKGRAAADIKFVIPMNQAVQWPKKQYKLDPYALGTFIGNGCLTVDPLILSSNDPETVNEVKHLIGATYAKKGKSNYNWTFGDPHPASPRFRLIQAFDIITAELLGKYSYQKFIPKEYQTGSIEQRWHLIQGLFDTDGSIVNNNNRFSISYSTTSLKLAKDIQHVLYSLGISSQITNNGKHAHGVHDEYQLHVQCDAKNKPNFFRLSRKKKIALKAIVAEASKKRHKTFDQVIGIRSITKLPKKQDATCIMVDDPEHLYQAGDFVVSHNTELAKAFTTAMFGESAQLTIFDMAEYQEPDDVTIFQKRLTDKVLSTNTPVILLDEIEKAAKGVGTLLFSVFDEARLNDKNGRPVNFANIFFLCTTNAGSHVFDDFAGRGYTDEESNQALEDYNKLIFENLANDPIFPTPLLGRMTGFVPFNPMTDATNKKIAHRQLRRVAKKFMEKQNVKVRYDEPNIIRYVTEEKLDDSAEAGGARQISTIIKKDITNNISRYLLFGHEDVTDVYVTTEGISRTLNENEVKSREKIKVEPTQATIIEDDYKNAVHKFKHELIKTLTTYKKMGLYIRANSKSIFQVLSRIDLDDDPKIAINELFKPVQEYIEDIKNWDVQYSKNPELAPEPRPKTHITITVANNEIEVHN